MLDKTIFVIVLRNPFHVTPSIFVCRDGKSEMTSDVGSILFYQKIISFGFEDIIDIIRLKYLSINSQVIDIVTIKKLCVGKSKKEYSNEMPWDFMQLIGKYIKKQTQNWINGIIKLEILEPEEDKNFHDNIVDLMGGFKRCFYDLENKLKESEEYKRFYTLELALYNVFLNTQKLGIRVSQNILNERLKNLKETYYSSIKKLELGYGFNANNISYNMDWDDIEEYCSDLVDFKSEFDYDFCSSCKLFQDGDEFISNLLTAYESYKDYHELLKYRLDKYSSVYPVFDINGTVTSRILIKSPGIQYIKKRNRDIFIPRE